MRSEQLDRASAAWRESLESLLATAEQVGPLDPFSDFAVAGVREEESLEALVDVQADAAIAQSQQVLQLLSPDLDSDPGARSQLLMLMIGNIETAGALVAASDSPDDFFGDFGLEAGPRAVLEPTRTDLADLQLAVAGIAPIRGAAVTLPPELGERFEALEDAGGKELCELASSETVWALGAGAVGGVATLLRDVQYFDIVRSAISGFAKSLKRAAMKVVKWIVERALALIPQSLRDKVDELWAELRDKVVDQAPEIVGSIAGRLLGRGTATERWEQAVAAGRDMSAAEAALPTSVDDCIKRIGWISKGRETVDKLSSKVVAAASSAGPAVQGAMGAALLVIFAFVAVQIWDGCNDIERLAPSA